MSAVIFRVWHNYKSTGEIPTDLHPKHIIGEAFIEGLINDEQYKAEMNKLREQEKEKA